MSDPEDLTPQQHRLHGLIVSNGKLLYDDSRRILSPLTEEPHKNSYYRLRQVKLRPVVSGDVIDYELPMERHRLIKISAETRWPEITVKKSSPNIEICWPSQLGTAPLEETQFIPGTQEGPKLTRTGLDITSQLYPEKAVNFVQADYLMGKIPALIEWSSHLPKFTTNPTLGFLFSQSILHSWPIYYFSKGEKFFLRVKPRLDLQKLLRMRRREGNAYIEMVPDLSYLQVIGATPQGETGLRIPAPDIWIYCLDVLDIEKRSILDGPSCIASPSEADLQISWFFDDFKQIEMDNDIGFDRSHTFEVKEPHIIKAVHLVVENLNATAHNNLGNYTTDESDLRTGFDVISSVEYKLGKETVSLPNHVIRNLMQGSFPGTPRVMGYLSIPLNLNPRITEETIGVAMGANNGYIKVNTADMSLVRETNNCRFKIHCYLQVLREIIFTYDPVTKSYSYKIN